MSDIFIPLTDISMDTRISLLLSFLAWKWRIKYQELSLQQSSVATSQATVSVMLLIFYSGSPSQAGSSWPTDKLSDPEYYGLLPLE